MNVAASVRLVQWLALVVISSSLSSACSGNAHSGPDTGAAGAADGGVPTRCEVGSEGCPCTSGGSCDAELTCASKVCVRAGRGEGVGGATVAENGGSESGTGGGTGATGGGASGGTATQVSTACAPGGGLCLKTADCCQTGSGVGALGTTCLTSDYLCHANCTDSAQCRSNCCVQLSGISAYGACADASYCGPITGGGNNGCTSDVQCLPSHPTPGCSYTCDNGGCVEVCNF